MDGTCLNQLGLTNLKRRFHENKLMYVAFNLVLINGYGPHRFTLPLDLAPPDLHELIIFH
jgi:hypothetical protein